MQQAASTMHIQDKQHKPLRVLMVTGVYPTAERPHKGTFVKSLVDSLTAVGVEVEVIHPEPSLPTLLRYAIVATQVFCKTLTKRFDVVNGHYGLWCLVARLQWTTPVVASYLGDDVLGTIITRGEYSSKGNFVAFISHKLCYFVDAVTVKSKQMKQRLGGPQEKVFVIPDGVNFAQFYPMPRSEVRATLGWDQDRYYVLFANNPEIPVKNFAMAQAAVDILRAKGIDVELVVATGLSHDTVMQYTNASNALILPSWAEGSPNVVREAMACNVPVVATNVGDVTDVIGHTEGCSICAHDPKELAVGLQRALEHTGSTTGRQDTQHLASIVIAQQVIELYEQILYKKGRRKLKEGATQNSPKDNVYV